MAPQERLPSVPGGITLASGAGPVTLGDGTTAGNNVLLSLASGQQTWANNSASNFTISNTAASFTRAIGSTLVFTTPSTGLFKMSTTVRPNTNGIIGPWAFYRSAGTADANTAAGYNYAYNNAGTIAAFTGATVSSWDAALASLPSSATTNYDITGGTGTNRGADVTANTLRVVSASASSIDFANTATIKTNGILNAGAGALTITSNDSFNSITIGSNNNRELVLAAMRGDITVDGRINNNGVAGDVQAGGGTDSAMTIMGGVGRTVTLAGSVSTLITGMTTVNSGALVLNRTSAANAIYTGGLTINTGGTARYGSSAGTDNIADTAAVTISGGILDINSKSDTVGAVTLNSGSITGTTGTLTGASYAVKDGSISAKLGGAVTLTKSTDGTVKLSGANTYTGATSVTGGNLIVTSASGLGTGAAANVSVASGAALNYAAAAKADLAIGGTLTLVGGTTIGSSIGSAADDANDARIKVAGAATTSGAVGVNIFGVPSLTPAAGTYTLLSAASGVNGATYSLGKVYNNTNFTVGTLAASATALTVPVTAATAITTAYWKGGLSGSENVWAVSNGSTASNWTTTAGGAVQALIPGSTADVTISATSPTTAPTATVLGANMTIKSLTIADTTNGLGLNDDSYTLTITPGASTVGITMNASVPASTIAANLALGAAQTWTNNSTNLLTISSPTITNGANALTVTGTGNTIISGVLGGGAGSLTKSGAGTLTLSGANTYTGTTTISEGTLKAGSLDTFRNIGALSMSSTGTFDLAGFDASFTNVAASVAGNTITNSVTGTSTLSITAQANAIAGLVTNGGAGKVLAVNLTNANGGTAPFTLTNANTFSGGLTLLNHSSGTRLVVNSAITNVGSAGAITSSPFGTGTITVGQTATDKAGIYFSSAANNTLLNAITFNTSVGTDRSGLRLDTTGVTLAGLITANADLVVSSGGNGSGSLTGQITGAGGLILDMTDGSVSLAVTLNNAGTANNYAGSTIINQGATAGRTATLTLGRANQIPNGTGKGDVTINTNGTGIGTLNLNNFSETINGLSGSGIVDGAISGGTTNTLTLGDNNTTGVSFSGTIKNTTGSLSLIKIGTGSQTFGGANTFTGGLTIKNGTIVASTVNTALGGATGTGTVTLGDTTGSNAATLLVGTTGLNYANPIVLATNASVGTLTLGNTGTAISTTFSGGVTGTNNLTINENATSGTITFATGAINNTGTITNIGVGTGTTTISANIGSNVTNVIQNSASAGLILSGSSNSYTGTTTISAGILRFGSAASIGGTGRSVTVDAGASVGMIGSTDFSGLTPRLATTSGGTIVLDANSSAAIDMSALTFASLGAAGAYTFSGTSLTPYGNDYRLGGGAGALTVSSAPFAASKNLIIKNGAGSSGATIGTGEVILTNDNTAFNGTVTITANSALQLGAGSTTGNVGSASSIDNAGVLAVNRSNAISLGAISGAGSLLKQGAGTLTLTANNTRTGALYLDGGTVAPSVDQTTTITGGIFFGTSESRYKHQHTEPHKRQHDRQFPDDADQQRHREYGDDWRGQEIDRQWNC